MAGDSGAMTTAVPIAVSPGPQTPWSPAPVAYPPVAAHPQAAYPTSGYPQAAMPGAFPGAAMPPATFPGAAAPGVGSQGVGSQGKRRSPITIMLAIVTVVLLLGVGGLAALYIGERGDLTRADKNNAATVAAEKKKLADLQSQVQAAADAATATKQTTDAEIADLNDKMKAYQNCANTFDKVNNTNYKTQASFDKAFNKLVIICEAAATQP
jgi:hypothetical protein